MPVARLSRCAVAIAILVGLQARAVGAQTDTARSRDTTRSIGVVKITGRIDNLIGSASSASQGRVGAADLRLRPLTREGELLEAVPGLIVTQHSGDGKANQYFVRGFNLDHGTDFQTRLEGMPVNMPSHAHGQGYTDLNFLIPELVDYIDYRLGVYHADLGDFGSAGGAEFHLARKLARPFGTIGVGENGLARVALGGSKKVGVGDFLLGGEVKSYDGPWAVPEEIRKLSGVARYSWTRNTSRFSILGMAYTNRWNSADQIPQRSVDAGQLDRVGVIDSTDGGRTQRFSLSGSWTHIGAKAVSDVQVYAIHSDLSLYSNFTYFLDDPEHGDQFNQHERRTILGATIKRQQQWHALGADHDVTFGLQTRVDFLSPVGLYHTERRARIGTVREDQVNETGNGVFAEAQSRWHPRFRSIVGLRGDAYTFDVTSNNVANSGERSAGIVSPKLSLVFAPTPASEVYVSGGLGFHSNDARGTTITVDPASGEPAQRVDPLVRSRGAEVGLRSNLLNGWRSTLSLWALELNSELLFVGDAGATEPTDRSERRGITWANFYRPIPSLALDADVSFAHARLRGADASANHIPGALENVLAAGITWAPKNGVFGAIRLRHFGAYPLIEDNSVRATATTLLNADAGFTVRGVRVQVTVLNLLNRRASDIQYYYSSRVAGESATGFSDIHFHPVEPRQVRLSLSRGL